MLAFVQDQLVNQLHWLTPREFLDGLALGQLTPGPVLMLAAYVGYKLCGIAGAAVGAFSIFLPVVHPGSVGPARPESLPASSPGSRRP